MEPRIGRRIELCIERLIERLIELRIEPPYVKLIFVLILKSLINGFIWNFRIKS